MPTARKLIADLRAAAMLLTRLPVQGGVLRPDAAWAFPLVGALVGAAGGAMLWAVRALHLPALPGAALAIAVQCWITGALHEDGLADTADGFGGGRTPVRRLEIMRDSRIGSYGALALGLMLLVRAGLLAVLPHPVAGMVCAAALGRGGIVLLAALLPPARKDGMGARMAQPGQTAIWAGLALAVLPCLALNAPPAAALAALAATLALAGLARRMLGGSTGDVFGAGAMLAECAALLVFAAG